MKNRLLSSCLFVLLATATAPVVAHAQSYSIDWYTVAGGGGTGSGGQFSLSGTIGQSDAGRMSGANFSVDGGFWAAFTAVQTLGSPLLRIQLTTTNTIIVAWPAPSTGFALQRNSDLATTNWVNVTDAMNTVGGENQVIVLPAPGNNFYRLVSP